MDKGTDATKMLNGDDIPLRLGYTGVRNRSQQEVKENLSIEEALKVRSLHACTCIHMLTCIIYI